MPRSLLDGTRVVDFSQYIPGPYASLMLADLGADVSRPAATPCASMGPSDPLQCRPFIAC